MNACCDQIWNVPNKGMASAARLAIEAGYADQAHMARGFKSSSGLTAGQIAQMLAIKT